MKPPIWPLVPLIACALSNAAFGDEVVYPTGTPDLDVSNIQAAVDGGGTVLLKATSLSGVPKSFSFGPPVAGSGFVLLRNDVALRGETVNGSMTTITGGTTAVRIFSSGRVAVSGIHFDGPRGAGILLAASSEAEITGNRINDVLGIVQSGISFARGIWVFGREVTGALVVADNVVDRLYADAGYGISVSSHDAIGTIAGNFVSGTDLNAILVGAFSQAQFVTENTVVPGPAQTPFGVGNGILVGHSRGGTAYIARNNVSCDNPWADGILIVAGGTSPLLAGDFVIEHNAVRMHGSLFGGISLYDRVARNLVRSNKVTGDGASALQVARAFESNPTSSENSFVGNNISGFKSTFADVFLDTNAVDSIVVGNAGTVVDLGTGNWISGFTKKQAQQSLGPRMRSAQESKRRSISSPAWTGEL